MQPDEELEGLVELAWPDDQAHDWSITTWAQKGKVTIELTSSPSRPSDPIVGYYAGEAPQASYIPVEVPEGEETPVKELSDDEEDGEDNEESESGPEEG